MALSAGTRLGPYEILEPLGAGGMGEVYRARDTRLDRTVAVKVLPADLAADPHLKARFEREARAISALAHPNICTLHDVGEENGRTFLVMEHLVGQTLADRLKKGPLPLEQALEVAAQMADALAAAHKQGIIHRDLKPGNVMLTKTGARLLDFGLARLTGQVDQPVVENLTSAPTEPEPLTGAGTIMGTLPYMAPEQVEGKEVDARTDLWALGAILYEMLSGHRAFEASSAMSLVGAILERDPPPLVERQSLTPPSLERLVRRCLAKDPDDRWDTAHDVADELRWIAEAAEAWDASRVRSTPRWVVLALLAAAVAALLAGILTDRWWLRHQSPALSKARPVVRASIVLPPGERLRLGNTSASVAISPDGSRIAYVSESEQGKQRISLRALDDNEPTTLPGTEGAASLFFSPDGQGLGFFADGKLKRTSVTGGAAITLAACDNCFGATWATDDTIILRNGPARGLSRISARGGPLEELISPDATKEEQSYLWPQTLPGGKAVLYTVHTADTATTDDTHIAVLSLESGDRRLLLEGGHDPRYVPTGHLVYARAGSLRAVEFNLERLEVTGPSVPVLAGVRTYQNQGAPCFAFGQNGTLVYVPGGPQPQRRLTWVNRKGVASLAAPEEDGYFEVRLSPDGQRIAVLRGWQNHNVWTHNLSRGTFSPLTHRWDQHGLAWTPDGKHVLFSSNSRGARSIFRKASDASGDVEQLLAADQTLFPQSISPDGEVLALTQRDALGDSDILLSALADPNDLREFHATHFREDRPRFAPDGRWIAYEADETGRWEVYVAPFPGPGGSVRVSIDGGRLPVWAPSGRELFFRNGDKMMAVPVETEPVFSAGRPQLLFEEAYQLSYDISPDGERFLMIQVPETEPVTQLRVVFNWFEELKAKMREAEE